MQLIRKYGIALVIIAGIAVITSAMLARRVDDRVTLRWPHIYEVTSAYHEQALWAAERVEQRTRGRVRIAVYPASALGNENAIAEALNLGSVDIIYLGPSIAAQYHAAVSLSEYPFVIDDYEHWKRYRDSDLFSEIMGGYEKTTGHRVIGFIYYGFRHITANKPILSPEDMRNLKIRVPNAPLYMIVPDATGANATPMPFSEVYLGLQQGVVDAQENPLTTIRYKRFHEVQSHINLTAHMSNSIMTVASSTALERIGPNDAEVLVNVATAAAARASEQVAQSERNLVQWFQDQGIRVNQVDREAFKALVGLALTRSRLPFSQDQYKRLRALAQP